MKTSNVSNLRRWLKCAYGSPLTGVTSYCVGSQRYSWTIFVCLNILSFFVVWIINVIRISCSSANVCVPLVLKSTISWDIVDVNDMTSSASSNVFIELPTYLANPYFMLNFRKVKPFDQVTQRVFKLTNVHEVGGKGWEPTFFYARVTKKHFCK